MYKNSPVVWLGAKLKVTDSISDIVFFPYSIVPIEFSQLGKSKRSSSVNSSIIEVPYLKLTILFHVRESKLPVYVSNVLFL